MAYDDLFPVLSSWLEEEGPATVEKDVLPLEVADEIATMHQQLNSIIQESQNLQFAFDRQQEIEDLQMHISQYGLSHDFVAWYDRGGKLTRFFKGKMPALESFDAIGDPNSQLAIAAQEDLKQIAGNVWKFIREMGKKIRKFLKGVTSVLMNYGKMQESKNKKARELLQNRKNDPTKADEDVKGFSAEEIQTYWNALRAEYGKMATAQNEIAANLSKTDGNNTDESTAKTIEEHVNATSTAFQGVMEKKPKEQRDMKAGQSQKETALSYLDLSDKILATIKGLNQLLNRATSTNEDVDKKAAQMENGQGTGNQKTAPTLKKFIEKSNKLAELIAKLLKEYEWCCSTAYGMCTQYGKFTTDGNGNNEEKKEEENKQEEQQEDNSSKTQQDLDLEDEWGSDGIRGMEAKGLRR